MEEKRWIKGCEQAIKRRIMHEFMGRDGTDSGRRHMFVKIT